MISVNLKKRPSQADYYHSFIHSFISFIYSFIYLFIFSSVRVVHGGRHWLNLSNEPIRSGHMIPTSKSSRQRARTHGRSMLSSFKLSTTFVKQYSVAAREFCNTGGGYGSGRHRRRRRRRSRCSIVYVQSSHYNKR